MKQAIGLAALWIPAALLLAGCGGTAAITYDGGESITVNRGEKLQQPDCSPRAGYELVGWYRDVARTEPWNFETDKVSADMTLYPLWDAADAAESAPAEPAEPPIPSPQEQEDGCVYRTFFLPSPDDGKQGYVGDPMPYYEDGVYYLYYLKDGGDSFQHSLYLATTTDFLSYTEVQDPILTSEAEAQDAWIGTGSVCKVGETYYLFYTGHTTSAKYEYKETILVAKGNDPYTFEKVEGWELTPPAELGQKNDFRDPQAYYDAETDTLSMTVTAAQDGVARILKFTLSADLTTHSYDGIIFTNHEVECWNLECSDTFKLGDTWYLTYSAQDDTLWYASSENRYGPYSGAKRLEGKLFYAAKHVEDAENAYMVGWARRSEYANYTQDVAAWAGNLVVQKLQQNADGSLSLVAVPAVAEQFSARRALLTPDSHQYLEAQDGYVYSDAFVCYERFKLTGDFTFTGTGNFGLCFDYNGNDYEYKTISFVPEENALRLYFNEESTLIAQRDVTLEPGKTYHFTYLQEGSVGVFYLDDLAALTVRLYGVGGKPIKLFAKDNSVLFSALRQYTL